MKRKIEKFISTMIGAIFAPYWFFNDSQGDRSKFIEPRKSGGTDVGTVYC